MIDIQTLDQEHKAFTFADFERRRQLVRGDEKALAVLEKEIAKVEAHYASTTPKERVSDEWFQIIENSLGDFGNCVVNRERREVTELSGAETVLHWIDTLKHHCEESDPHQDWPRFVMCNVLHAIEDMLREERQDGELEPNIG